MELTEFGRRDLLRRYEQALRLRDFEDETEMSDRSNLIGCRSDHARTGSRRSRHRDFEDRDPTPEDTSDVSEANDSNFNTGAVRSADANNLRFDLIHPLVKIALARTYAEGATKYGDANWERGMPAHDLYNHVDRHLTLWRAGDRSEPHLSHALWGVGAMIVSETLWPHLNAPHLRGPGCTLTPAMLAHQEAGDPERKARRASGEFDNLGDWQVADIPEVARILEQRKEASA